MEKLIAETMAEATGFSLPQSPMTRLRRVAGETIRDGSVRAGATRAALLPLTSAAGLYTAHIELASLGGARFGILALLLSITLLVPFADFGLGAAVTSSVATEARSAAHRVVAAGFRVLVGAGGAVLVIGGALAASHSWSSLTGVSPNEVPTLDRDMLIVTLLFAFALPLSLSGRILLALNRYPLYLVLQAGASGLTLLVVVAYRQSTTIVPFLIAPFVAQLAMSLVAFSMACRYLDLQLGPLCRLVFSRDFRVPQYVRSTAAPMFVITVGLPLALQTDRLVLSHFASRTALTQYAIVAMVFGPGWSIISSAGLTLWPRFAVARSAAEDSVATYRSSFVVFAVVGTGGAVALLAAGPVITRVWAGSTGGAGLWVAFSLLLLIQAAHLPGGMFMTRPDELRFQARCVLLMCVANLPLSIALAGVIGAPGPVVASALTICCLQLMPTRRRVLRSEPLEVPR